MVIEVMSGKHFALTTFLPEGSMRVCPAFLPRREKKYQRLCGSSFFSLTTAVLPSTSQFISSLTCHSPEALWAGLYRKGKASGKKEGNWLKEMYRQTWFYCSSRYCASKIMHVIFGGGIGFVFTIDIRGNMCRASLSTLFSQWHLLTSCFLVSFW